MPSLRRSHCLPIRALLAACLISPVQLLADLPPETLSIGRPVTVTDNAPWDIDIAPGRE